MRKEAILTPVFCLLALGLLAAQEERPQYTLKIKAYPAAGKSFTVQSTDQLDSTLTIEEKGKAGAPMKESTTRTEVYTQKTLTVVDGKLESFQRTYTSSEVSDGKEKMATALQGKTITLKVDKRGCTHDLKDKLPPEELKKLTDAHGDGLAVILKLLPETPVREGDEWPLTGKQIVTGMMAIPVDPERSRGKGKLVKVEKKGEVPVGTLEFTLELETIAGAEGTGKGTFVILAETPIDGSSTAAKLTLKGNLTLQAEEKADKEVKKFTAVATGEFKAEISEEK